MISPESFESHVPLDPEIAERVFPHDPEAETLEAWRKKNVIGTKPIDWPGFEDTTDSQGNRVRMREEVYPEEFDPNVLPPEDERDHPWKDSATTTFPDAQ